MGSKSSDEYALPLCALHHRDLHDHGNEREWWTSKNIEPVDAALNLWVQTQSERSKSENAPAARGKGPDRTTEAAQTLSPNSELVTEAKGFTRPQGADDH